MAYFVLVSWLVQGTAGVVLLTKWLRHGGRGPGPVVTHVVCGVVGLGFWVAFIVTDAVVWAWIAFAVISVGNGFGDWMFVQRGRRLSGERNGYWRDYGRVIAASMKRRLPASVTFHSWFSAVVWFSCLGVCIGASIA